MTWTLPAAAGSAENDRVVVTCDAPGVVVKNNGKDFLILATEYHDSFVAEVTVRARNEWELVEPNEASQPLRMACGDTATYSVSKPPEDAG